MNKAAGLKTKLIAIQVLPTAAVFLVISVFWVKTTLEENYRSLQNRGTIETTLIAENLQAAVLFKDHDAMEDILNSASNDNAFTQVSISDSSGVTLMELTFREFDRANNSGLARKIYNYFYGQQHTLIIQKPIRFEDRDIGLLEAELVTSEIVSAISTVLNGLLFILAMGLALFLVLNRTLHHMVVRPILKISNFTRKIISTQNYRSRLTISNTGEIGRLADDLNHMLAMVDERDRYLEDTVRKRTDELSQKNNTLETQLAEIHRLERERALTEKRFEQFFLQAPVATIIMTPDGKITLHNAVFDRLMGLSDKSAVSFERFICPEDLDLFNEHLDCLITRGESNSEFKASCCPASGGKIKTVISMSSLRASENRLLYLILQFLDVSESDRLARELEYQANHDALTSLPNRRFLKEKLAEAIETRCEDAKTHALCFLDLDRFKTINDSSGHAAGDQLLQQLSQLLLGEIGPNDFLARLGGDEFAILLIDSNDSSARNTLESIRKRIESFEFVWDSRSYRVGVSVGIVLFNDPDTDIGLLMKAADSACYYAKDHGRNQIHVGSLDQIESP